MYGPPRSTHQADLGGTPGVFPCDVTDEDAVTEMEAAVRRRFGVADVLINNAGKYAGGPFLSTTASEFDRMLAANLRSLFLVSRAFARAMVRRRRGDIFNMGSIAGITAMPGAPAYVAAKFGVAGLSKAMRAEFRDKGVRVCCVHPGAAVCLDRAVFRPGLLLGSGFGKTKAGGFVCSQGTRGADRTG